MPPAVVEEVCTITAKGQTTVPKAVRQALGVGYGGRIAFRVERGRVTVHGLPGRFAIAGTDRTVASCPNTASVAVSPFCLQRTFVGTSSNSTSLPSSCIANDFVSAFFSAPAG